MELDIAKLQREGESRERAVLELALQCGKWVLELQKLEEEGRTEEEAISKFLKGKKLHLTEADQEIQDIVEEVFRDKIYKQSVSEVEKKKPTALWYLVPLFFGIIGGLIGYIGVKEEDRNMAMNLLTIGIVMWFIDLVVLWLIYSWLSSLFWY